MPSAALVHDHFTGPTGMGLVVGRHARWLLDADWAVTLVGDNVPADLAAACQVIPARAPHRLTSHLEHLVWCHRARHALASIRADVVHVHSPLLATDADLLTSHFIARPAYERGVREQASGVTGILRTLQATISRRADDNAYRRSAAGTFVSFVSEFLRDEYRRFYGPPRGGWILAPPAPVWHPITQLERDDARARFGVNPGPITVGYIGGSDPRKGYLALEQLAGDGDISVLVGGPGSQQMVVAGQRGHGFVDIDAFYAACDVVVAPAVFDSAPVAVLQAVARDLPVVITSSSGWAPAIARLGGGVVWDGAERLAGAIRRAATDTTRGQRQALLEEFAEHRLQSVLLGAYEEIVSGGEAAR